MTTLVASSRNRLGSSLRKTIITDTMRGVAAEQNEKDYGFVGSPMKGVRDGR